LPEDDQQLDYAEEVSFNIMSVICVFFEIIKLFKSIVSIPVTNIVFGKEAFQNF